MAPKKKATTTAEKLAKGETAAPAEPVAKTPTRTPMAKWQVAQVYRAYMNREGPQNLGTVEWPKPKRGCLKGVKVLSTGVFETIEREDLVELLEGCGAHHYSGMSKNLHYLLVGRDAGPVKLQVAEENNIPQLSEAEFFTWIKEKIDNHVPSSDDEVDVKTKPAKGKAAVKAAASKPETKPRKAPVKRAPLPQVPDYDSDQTSESDEDVSDEDPSDENEEDAAPPPNKKQASKASAAKRGRPAAGRGKAAAKAATNGVKSEVTESDHVGDHVAAVPSKPAKPAANKTAAKRGRPAGRGKAAVAKNGIKSETAESGDNPVTEKPVAPEVPVTNSSGRRRGRPPGRGKAAAAEKSEEVVVKEESIDTNEDAIADLPEEPVAKMRGTAAKRRREPGFRTMAVPNCRKGPPK